MTIVEFLTARLDELEDGTREGLRTEEHGVSQFDLDEIAAKRAIVAEWERIDRSKDAYPNAVNIASFMAMTFCVRQLASPYYDHPDYPQERVV